MKSVADIYTAYRTMPALQMHQLRVAAVGKLVAEKIGGVDVRSVVLAGLFHDMGNIIKSDFDVFPQFLEPEGRGYWQTVKDEYIAKYGTRSHEANVAIAREAGLPEGVAALIDGMSFAHMSNIYSSGSTEQKIVEYGDMRVGPYGVISLEERFADSQVRYQHRYATPEEASAVYQDLLSWASLIEGQLCERGHIAPTDISDASVAPLIEELRHFQVG